VLPTIWFLFGFSVQIRPVEVFFLSQIDFSFGDSCVSTATGQFLLSTDFSWSTAPWFLFPRSSREHKWLPARASSAPASVFPPSVHSSFCLTVLPAVFGSAQSAPTGLRSTSPVPTARILVSSGSHAQAAPVLGLVAGVTSSILIFSMFVLSDFV
jgi:hypothetical protein